MFNSLSQFYNSKEWKSVRQQIINDRTSKIDGVLYCEHSRKPLLQSYDIVAHHKTPLTMSNVNDFNISLNPENIMIVSQQAHNEIHSRFGFTAQRKVYFVYGSPCSGKTTFVKNIKGNSDIVIDVDNIWQCLTAGERYEKPNALKQNVFTVRDCLMDMIRTRAGKWERAWVLSSESVESIRNRTIESLGAEAICIDTPKEECLKRLHANPNGRDIAQWTKYIERYFEG